MPGFPTRLIRFAPSILLPKHLFASIRRQQPPIRVAQTVIESAALSLDAVFERLGSRSTGLTTDEAATRLAEYGPNVVAGDARKSVQLLLWHAVRNPLVVLLTVLATISFATGDARAGTVMSLMIAMGVALRLIQEAKADNAAAKLKAMISVTATAFRDG
ncbi:MAG: cation-transporting P-type ATPase [Planctomycetota bacterium]